MVDRLEIWLDEIFEKKVEWAKSQYKRVTEREKVNKEEDPDEDLKDADVSSSEEKAREVKDQFGMEKKLTFKRVNKKKQAADDRQQKNEMEDFKVHCQLTHGDSEGWMDEGTNDFDKEELDMICCALKNEMGGLRD